MEPVCKPGGDGSGLILLKVIFCGSIDFDIFPGRYIIRFPASCLCRYFPVCSNRFSRFGTSGLSHPDSQSLFIVFYMSGFEIWGLALGLAMDGFAISIASGVALQRVRWRPILLIAMSFCFFQIVNPLIGWLGTFHFRGLIDHVDHWIAFAILVFLGIRMLRESFRVREDGESKPFDPNNPKLVLAMALATSIDALAVGMTFAVMGMNTLRSLVYPLGVIGFVTMMLSFTGVFVGIRFGQHVTKRIRADLWGGLILIVIGIKVLYSNIPF